MKGYFKKSHINIYAFKKQFLQNKDKKKLFLPMSSKL